MNPVSVRTAITRGIKVLRVPARQILLAAVIATVLIWSGIGFFWWTLFIIPFGIFVAYIYASRMRPKWRIWAYTNVTDIHQFQRAAELARLLPLGSHDDLRGWMPLYQRKKLSEQVERFMQDPGFIDDPAIPEETKVYEKTLLTKGDPLLIISATGIRIVGEGTFGWDEIAGERIAHVAFKAMHPLFRHDIRPTTTRYFRITCGSKQYEFVMENLKISAWELDLLMYMYRGRWMTINSPFEGG